MFLGKWEGASGKKNDRMPKREGLFPGEGLMSRLRNKAYRTLFLQS